MKSEGKIVKEEEPAYDDFDDLEILLDNDSKSETQSEVRINLYFYTNYYIRLYSGVALDQKP
jgi:hypothetical protein